MFMRVTRRLRVKTSWDVCTSITSGCASQRVHERERLFLLHNRTDVWCGIARGDRADESCHVCVCDEACDGWAWMCDTVWHSVIHCDTVHSECVIHCDTYCDEACDGCTVMRHVMGAQWWGMWWVHSDEACDGCTVTVWHTVTHVVICGRHSVIHISISKYFSISATVSSSLSLVALLLYLHTRANGTYTHYVHNECVSVYICFNIYM